MKERKYKLVMDDSVQTETGATVYRIRACKDFGNIKKGDLGGYIERESNLSHEGDAWVSQDAKIYENAWVFGNARIHENARVRGNVIVFGEAHVYGNALLFNNARVYDKAWVTGHTKVYGNARICEEAKVESRSRVLENACIYGKAIVSDDVVVFGEAKVDGDVKLRGKGYIQGNAIIERKEDYFIAQPVGSENESESGILTAFVSEKGIEISHGDFLGTIQEFEEKVIETHEDDNKMREEYQILLSFIKLKFNKQR